MLTFIDPEEVDLDDLIVDLDADGPCDIVIGGRSKKRALERFAETLRFPDWFGHNLDALFDLLDEHAHAATSSGAGWTLLWVPGRKLRRDRPHDYAGIVSVLRDVVAGRSGDTEQGQRTVVIYAPDPSGVEAEENS